MKAYIWILELAGAAGLFLLLRFVWLRFRARGERAAQAVRKNRNAVSRAERDRLDIEALTQKMSGSAPMGAGSPGASSPSAGAAREERGRRAATHSSFDPDLPVPAKNETSGN